MTCCEPESSGDEESQIQGGAFALPSRVSPQRFSRSEWPLSLSGEFSMSGAMPSHLPGILVADAPGFFSPFPGGLAGSRETAIKNRNYVPRARTLRRNLSGAACRQVPNGPLAFFYGYGRTRSHLGQGIFVPDHTLTRPQHMGTINSPSVLARLAFFPLYPKKK